MHDTKVLHITVRNVCHAVCPGAILDLNVNYGNEDKNGPRRESEIDGEAAETDHHLRKKKEGGWKSEHKRAEEKN